MTGMGSMRAFSAPQPKITMTAAGTSDFDHSGERAQAEHQVAAFEIGFRRFENLNFSSSCIGVDTQLRHPGRCRLPARPTGSYT